MNIENQIQSLPWHATRKWKQRNVIAINKIIVHQELANGNIAAVNNYHVKPNHVCQEGCPHFCYHFGIEFDGRVIQANKITDLIYHTRGQNTQSIGIMLVGDFDGPGHKGSRKPTPEQLSSLKELLDYLTSLYRIDKRNIYGHSDYGKPACPGTEVMEMIQKYRRYGI